MRRWIGWLILAAVVLAGCNKGEEAVDPNDPRLNSNVSGQEPVVGGPDGPGPTAKGR